MSTKQETDWKVAGRLIQRLNNLFALVRSILAKQDIQLGEFVDWSLGSGKEHFTQSLKALGQEYLKAKPIERVRVINATTIEVNLDATPKPPFAGAQIEHQSTGEQGWVTVEKKADGLYVADRKVTLWLSEHQQGDKSLRGHELREELTGALVLHPNILDALYEHQSLIPEDWKKDEQGRIRFVFFWTVIFRNADGDLFVRDLYFHGGQWIISYDWLDRVWSVCHPAAWLAC